MIILSEKLMDVLAKIQEGITVSLASTSPAFVVASSGCRDCYGSCSGDCSGGGCSDSCSGGCSGSCQRFTY